MSRRRWYVEVMGMVVSLTPAQASSFVAEAIRTNACPDPTDFGGKRLSLEWTATERNMGQPPLRFRGRLIRGLDQPRDWWKDIAENIANDDDID